MPSLLAYWPIAAGIAALYFFQKIWIEYSHRRRASALGCGPVYRRQGKLPFSVDQTYKAFRALQDNEFLNLEVTTHQDLGRSTFTQPNLGRDLLMTTDPENVKALLATQFKDFGLGPMRLKILEPLLGLGIFTSDGKDWQHSRAILRPQFTRTQISNLHVEEIHVQHLLNRFEHGANGWTKDVNLVPLFFNLTLDSATEFLFGKSVNTQVLGGPRAERTTTEKGSADEIEDWSSFGRSFDNANQTMTQRFLLMNLYFLHNPASLQQSCAEVRRFADYYVRRALARSPALAQEEDGTDYVFLNELVKETRDPDVLRNQLLNILLAGRDTTAGLLGWTTLRLARQPEVYAKLRAAVLAAFGPYSASDTSRITFESLKACAYMQHVLSETLRLHPSVPTNFRHALRDTTLPRGGGDDGQAPIYIRAGCNVLYSTNVMHRRPDLWGPDADEFKPERWENKKFGWEYLPFNGGPRICLGQQFALTEAAYVLVRLVQKYDAMENLDTSPTIKSNLTLTSSPIQTLVRLHEASDRVE
ncbi:Cytochrome P450 [Cordyceps militaris CM01]|uniref:Cytochrome P450 n=1 Tax=Cordyceps militaris (strain CM01) TaxID=983644 RepID=G3JQU8_CORMM|nr:Cytochrome P450 [Cordyceps militaris CM01]EGX89124.1 Cytochrome P450 [Cordyceps militaris CM01]